MRNLYEINADILALIDEETGEIFDEAAFDALAMERDEKLESLGLWYKDLNAEAEAIKKEIETLTARMKHTEKKAASVRNLLSDNLGGKKINTPRLSVSFRRTEAVEVDDSFLEWALMNDDQYLTYAEPKINKTAIKDAIKNGLDVPYARLAEHNNIIIK